MIRIRSVFCRLAVGICWPLLFIVFIDYFKTLKPAREQQFLNFSVDLSHSDIEWNGTCIRKRREKKGERGGGGGEKI